MKSIYARYENYRTKDLLKVSIRDIKENPWVLFKKEI